MSFRLETREFSTTLKRYLEVSKHTLPKILNTKAFFIAKGATATTQKVPKSRIMHEMGVLGNEVKMRTRGKGAGTFKKGKWILGDTRTNETLSFAERIINKRERDSGVFTDAETRKEKARALIRARIASSGFIAAGWRPAIALLAAYAFKERGQKDDKSVRLISKKPMGGAEPAKPGIKVWVTIWNAAMAQKGTSENKEEALQKHATAGLQKALNEEVKSMEGYIERKMQEMTDKVTKSFLR